MSKETYHRLTEENSWEGETWYHYFLDEPGVYEALKSLLERFPDSDLTDFETLELSDEEATTLVNIDDVGYMQTYWFGYLDVTKLSNISNVDDLYKGKIRDYAEDMFELVKVEQE